MSVFAISDLHLPGGAGINKSMNIFGPRWQNHTSRLESSWRACIGGTDTVVVAGDISWAMTLTDARDDLLFLDSLPGRKIIIEGNHDYWWQTTSKLDAFFTENGIKTIKPLRADAVMADGLAICGTRGWFSSEAAQCASYDADYEKIARREASRLRASIDAALALTGGDTAPLRVFLHFPASFGGEECTPIMETLRERGISRVWFGHVHGSYSYPSAYEAGGIMHCATAADYLGFAPRLIT